MSSLNDLRGKFKEEIQAAADDLNNSLPMSKPQIRAAFNDTEIKQLHNMITEVKKAKTKNEKAAKLTEHAMTAIGLLKKLGVGI